MEEDGLSGRFNHLCLGMAFSMTRYDGTWRLYEIVFSTEHIISHLRCDISPCPLATLLASGLRLR